MEKKHNSILLSIIAGLLALISWGGNNIYNDQKELNIKITTEIQNIHETQIILNYRLSQIER